MKRKILTGLAVAATLFIFLCLEASGNERRKEISSTCRVVIDGRSFASDESSSDEGSLLKREIGRLGIRLPDGFNLPEDSGPSHPAFSRRLKESRPRFLETPRLPAGLTVEHTLRMEGEGRRSTSFSENWAPRDLPSATACSPPAGIPYPPCRIPEEPACCNIIRGKETTIVCLDEAEGAFLLFREVGR